MYVWIYVYMYVCVYVCMYVLMCVCTAIQMGSQHTEVHNNLTWVYWLLGGTKVPHTLLFCMYSAQCYREREDVVLFTEKELNAYCAWPTVQFTLHITTAVWLCKFNKILIQCTLTVIKTNSTLPILITLHSVMVVLTLLHS
jgi:hypothetical protein